MTNRINSFCYVLIWPYTVMGEIFNVNASKILGETYNIILINGLHSLWLLTNFLQYICHIFPFHCAPFRTKLASWQQYYTSFTVSLYGSEFQCMK